MVKDHSNHILKPPEVTLEDYLSLFVQREPHYAVKRANGGRWRTVHAPLTNSRVTKHLTGAEHVAVLGRWYPEYCVIDIDSKPMSFVEDVRGELGLDHSNSLVVSSESKDSYHILLRPIFNERPPTLNLLMEHFDGFCARRGVEVYPQRNRPVRLPFGPVQRILEPGMEWIDHWAIKTFWFQKLDECDLCQMPAEQPYLPLVLPHEQGRVSMYVEGQSLLQTGLRAPSTRHDAQFKVLYFLWRRNIPYHTAIDIARKWIREKHNGFSRDIKAHPREVIIR